jgi:WD40 repeat protein
MAPSLHRFFIGMELAFHRCLAKLGFACPGGGHDDLSKLFVGHIVFVVESACESPCLIWALTRQKALAQTRKADMRMKIVLGVLLTTAVAAGAAVLLPRSPQPHHAQEATPQVQSSKPSGSQQPVPGPRQPPQPTIVGISISPDAKQALIMERRPERALLYLLDPDSGKRLPIGDLKPPELVLEKGTCAVYSPDGHHVFAGDGYGSVTCWDVRNGKEIWFRKGHDDWVRSLTCTPDGKIVFSFSADKTVQFWDAETGKFIRQLGPIETPFTAALSPDGKWVLAEAQEVDLEGNLLSGHRVQLWDVSEGKVARELSGPSHFVHSLSFSADGKLALAADANGVITIWKVANWAPFRTLKLSVEDKRRLGFRDRNPVLPSTAVFTKDGRYVLHSAGSALLLWEVASGKIALISEGADFGFERLVVLPDGTRVLTAGPDIVVLWDLRAGEEIRTLLSTRREGPGVRNVVFLPDGKKLLATTDQNTATLWEIATGKPFWSTPLGYTYSSISADGKLLFSHEGPTIGLWELASGKNIWGKNHSYYAAALSPDGNLILGGRFFESQMDLLDAASGQVIRKLALPDKVCVTLIAISVDNHWALSRSSDHKVRLWDLSNGKIAKTFDDPWPSDKGGNPGYASLAFSRDGKRAISRQFMTRSWDLETGALEESVFNVPEGRGLAACSPLPDGNWAAGVDIQQPFDGRFEVWDLTTGRLVQTLGPAKGRRRTIIEFAFSPDGKSVAVAGRSSLLQVWDVKTGKLVKDFVQTPSLPKASGQ